MQSLGGNLASKEQNVILNNMRRIITGEEYDQDISKQGIQFQIDYYFEPKEKFWQERIKRVMHYLNPQKGEKILDVGCGVGTFAIHSAKQGAFGYGIDYSKESIKMAKLVSSKYNLSKKTRFMVSDATKLPFKNNFFDKIVSADFVEHIYYDETKEVVEEMMRVLKPGGLSVFYTPNRNPQTLNVIVQKTKRLLTFKNPTEFNLLTPAPVHVGLKTPYEIQRLFEESGLKFKIILFARDIALPFPLSKLWLFICEQFFLTKTLLAERILLVGQKKG